MRYKPALYVQYVHHSIYGGASSGAAISALPLLHYHSPDHTRCFQVSTEVVNGFPVAFEV